MLILAEQPQRASLQYFCSQANQYSLNTYLRTYLRFTVAALHLVIRAEAAENLGLCEEEGQRELKYRKSKEDEYESGVCILPTLQVVSSEHFCLAKG